MKRLITCLLCLLMLPALALAEDKADLWAHIRALVEAECDLGPRTYAPHQLNGSKEEGWQFSVYLPHQPEGDDGLIKGTLSPSLELLSLDRPQRYAVWAQAFDEVSSCFDQEDCYLRLAQAVKDWADRHDELPSFSISTPAPIENILLLDIRVPEADTIPYFDALSAAQRRLLAIPGWDEKTLMHFKVHISAYMVPEDIGKPVWLFVFNQEINTDPGTEAYAAALKEAQDYTINGEPAPVHFSVLVDAKTGAIIEEPRFDYAPVVFQSPDFIIRPRWFQGYSDGGFG